jgi:predicted phosphodiesterase
VASWLRGADLILHAGDVCTAAVLDELAQYAPVTAVVGNNLAGTGGLADGLPKST